MNQLLEGGLIGNFETLFNISLQDIAYQILYIGLVVADNVELRKPTQFRPYVSPILPVGQKESALSFSYLT